MDLEAIDGKEDIKIPSEPWSPQASEDTVA